MMPPIFTMIVIVKTASEPLRVKTSFEGFAGAFPSPFRWSWPLD
jgi:hypothetical protein